VTEGEKKGRKYYQKTTEVNKRTRTQVLIADLEGLGPLAEESGKEEGKFIKT